MRKWSQDEQNLQKPGRKYDSVQALRALAAFMVLIFHSKIMVWPRTEQSQLWWWPGFSDFGDLGVSLFFVISGFIIANSVSSPRFTVGLFAWRRIFRLYPLYLIVTSVGLLQYWRLGWFRADVESLGFSGIVKSFLIFPQKPFPLWNPGWSLEHEVIFYAIAAVVAPWLGLRVLVALLAMLWMIGIIFTFQWDYHLFASAQIYFGAGVLAFLFKDQGHRKAAPIACVLFLIAYAGFYKFIPISFEIAGVVFAFGSSALIVALISMEKTMTVPRPLVWMGDASYSLYLWHWMVLVYIGIWREVYGGSPELWRWIFVVVSIAVSLVSYQIIERPFIALGHRRWPNIKRPLLSTQSRPDHKTAGN